MITNKEILKDYLHELWDKRELSALDKYVVENAVVRSPLGTVKGKEKMLEIIAKWFIAFPDLSFTWDEFVAENDTVAVRWTATGTQSGQFYDLNPTNKKISWPGVAFYTFKKGKIVNYWAIVDMEKIFSQLMPR